MENFIMKRILSPLQKIVTGLLCDGLTTKEVAENLQVSEGTAQNIISMILLKTNSKTRAELAAKAVRLGCVAKDAATV